MQNAKGVQEILEVAKLLQEINFVLAGPVSKEIELLSRPDNIAFLGNVKHEKVKNLLDQADVFLFPSHSEGFANALLEAMARGVPIITTPVGSNADMIEQFGGILVGVKNVHDIIEALSSLGSEDIRSEMSIWNINKVKKFIQSIK